MRSPVRTVGAMHVGAPNSSCPCSCQRQAFSRPSNTCVIALHVLLRLVIRVVLALNTKIIYEEVKMCSAQKTKNERHKERNVLKKKICLMPNNLRQTS